MKDEAGFSKKQNKMEFTPHHKDTNNLRQTPRAFVYGAGFIFWHYSTGIRNFFEVWRNFLLFFWRYFAVGWHLKTLFAPWKRDISQVGRRGFHPVLWLQAAFENIVTRILGAIVRSFVVIFGLVCEVLAILVGFLTFTFWLALPFFLISPVLALISFSTGSQIGSLLWIFLWLCSLFVLLFSRSLYKDSKKDYFSMSLSELSQEEWFSRVWERIGKMPSASTVGSLDVPGLLNRFLESCGITQAGFQLILEWELNNQIEKENKNKFWIRENLESPMPIGRHWTFAYTVNLDKYSQDLSQGDWSEYKDAKLVGREKDLGMLELILTRPNQNNALIVAEAGVGKHTLVHALAWKVRSGKINPLLRNKRILEINLREITSGVPLHQALEGTLGEIFFEAAYAGNTILIIDDIDQFLKSHPQSEREDISKVLTEFLNWPTFQVIGLTTPEKYHTDLEKNTRLMKFFEKIQLGETGPENVIKILLYKLKNEEKNKIIFTYPALKEIVKLSERYFSETPFPEKAIDLMEETLLYWSQYSAEEYISPQVIDEVVAGKVKMPIGDMEKTEKERLMHLEEILHQRIIGQDFAIRQIAETMRRARVGMASENKPLGSFLFLGPTGVGKTESAKTLAEAFFGSENRMTRLDMSEFQKADAIDRLIGSAESGKTGILADKVRENPYTLLLLDEIEKAYPDILNLFLQILDEGFLTDAFGKKINFKNQIIIATSNAGSDIIKESIEKNIPPEGIQKQVTDYAIKNGIFRPELLNRFEGVIFFHPLSQDNVLRVTEKMLANYANRLKKEKNITITFEPDVVVKVAQESFDPVFGARATYRYIEDKIGDNVVKKIINEEIKEGDSFVFGARDLL